MLKHVAVSLGIIVLAGALIGAALLCPLRVFAASGTLTVATPLHDTPTSDATVVTLLPEGSIVSIEGEPVDGLNVKLDSSAANGSTTDDHGRYVLSVPSGPISLSVLQHGKIQKRVKLRVPSESYDIMLDE